eukprot:6184110-Pleurochrysis_carterae.AAC.3
MNRMSCGLVCVRKAAAAAAGVGRARIAVVGKRNSVGVEGAAREEAKVEVDSRRARVQLHAQQADTQHARLPIPC